MKKADGPNPPANDWMTVEIIARGNVFTVKINGKIVTEFTDEDEKRPTKGYSGFHVNGKKAAVQIRKAEVLPFSPLPTTK
ncbi:hypothetical protein FRUB_07772 [Fimbriiglobus ruber]|uniref:3-keto-alpha-glucoside-1,2-lyase/3-keto-2-hydroxy-glucal hydratase domain-containing protein n=2 Tax=Fimbriiglobus ruber TaxID=1908690 RepID=A0A225DB13_9BACT|nr:hypothetical protein FRUB_07772 [Fimbriiglobus ruber]